jgi:hypothetical protein
MDSMVRGRRSSLFECIGLSIAMAAPNPFLGASVHLPLCGGLCRDAAVTSCAQVLLWRPGEADLLRNTKPEGSLIAVQHILFISVR